MIRLVGLFLFITLALKLSGQSGYYEAYVYQDSLINQALKEEKYSLAAGLIGQQILLIRSYGLYDSLYKYCYNYGRAVWKTDGVEKGLAEAKKISDEVKEKDPNLLNYLQTINDLSWLYYETGNLKLCLENDSLYLAICLSNDNIPTKTLSIAYYNLGFDYVELGKYREALAHFQQSIEVILNSEDTLEKQLSMNYNALGAMQWRVGELEDAKKSFGESLKLVQQYDDPKSMLEQGNILGNMALIYQDNGEIIKAKELQERFLDIDSRALPFIEDAYLKETALRRMSSAYINLADIYFKLGDYAKARNLIELAIEERRKILEPDDPLLANALEHLAFIELNSGDLNRAEEKLTDYLNYCLNYFGEKSALTAWAYKEMGKLFLKKKQYMQSQEHYNKAIAIQLLINDQMGTPDLASIYRSRSELYADMKQYELAISDLQKSISIYRNSLDRKNNIFSGIFLQVAENLLMINDLNGAEESIEVAFELLKDTANKPKTNPYVLTEAYYLKAKVRIQKDSSMLDLIEALHDLERGINYLKTKKQIFQDEESKLMLYGAHEKVFDLAEKVAFNLYKKTNDQQWLDKLFSLTEENRTILLRNRLQNFSSLDYAGIPDTILTKERQLELRLRNKGNDPEITKSIVDTERKYNQFKALIREQYPEYYALKYRDKDISIADVQKTLLNEEQSILIYSVTQQHVYTILIDQNNSRAIKMPIDNLDKEVEAINKAIIIRDEDAFGEYSTRLFNRLIKPIKPFIKTNEIIIVPDKELFFLNFEILGEHMHDDPFDFKNMLIDEYVISYDLSTSVAMQFQQLAGRNNNKLIAFAPGFSDHQKLAYRQSVADSAQIDKKFLSFIRQPFTVKSAQQIAGIYSGTSFIDDKADETTFKNEAGKYGIIHLGTHAEINQQSPLMSHLVMSKNINKDSLDDGYLHAYEIYEMPLRAELAVLTACETGVGKHQNSEGVVSLAHSFSYAGCPSIVMALWNIDEKTSSEIINGFYHYLSSGMTKNRALRQAKLDFLEHSPTTLKSPYYWAGLVLMGSNDPIEIEPASDRYAVILVAGLAILVVVYLIRRRNRRITGAF